MLRMPKPLLRKIFDHSRQALPHECLGLLVGNGIDAINAIPLNNVSYTPEVEYLADPRQLLEALRSADKAGLEVVAIYHSHPSGPAYPSAADRERAIWRTNYVIIDPLAEEVRAFILPDGEEVELFVE